MTTDGYNTRSRRSSPAWPDDLAGGYLDARPEDVWTEPESVRPPTPPRGQVYLPSPTGSRSAPAWTPPGSAGAPDDLPIGENPGQAAAPRKHRSDAEPPHVAAPRQFTDPGPGSVAAPRDASDPASGALPRQAPSNPAPAGAGPSSQPFPRQPLGARRYRRTRSDGGVESTSAWWPASDGRGGQPEPRPNTPPGSEPTERTDASALWQPSRPDDERTVIADVLGGPAVPPPSRGTPPAGFRRPPGVAASAPAGAGTAPGRAPHPADRETVVLPAVPPEAPAGLAQGGDPGGPDTGRYDYYAGPPADDWDADQHAEAQAGDRLDDEPPRSGLRAEPIGAGGGRPGPGVVGVVGELVLTLGVVILLFVVYEVWWTDLISAGRQHDATSELDKEWQHGGDPLNGRGNHLNLDGQGFAKLFIPKFGPDFAFTVLQGTDDATLASGPGHYKDSQMPGEPGDFAVAGHRVGKGSPFNDLGLLNSCDSIVVETATSWEVYRVLPMKDEAASWATGRGQSDPYCKGIAPLTGVYSKTVGREIVLPSDTDVILPVPNRPDLSGPPKTNPLALITLTTCHPQFSDKQRMIIHGVLVKTYPNNPAHPVAPPELTEPDQG